MAAKRSTGCGTWLVLLLIIIIGYVVLKPSDQPKSKRPADFDASPTSRSGPKPEGGFVIAPRSEATTEPEAAKVQALEVELLKVYMTSRSHASIDIRFVNSSDVYLQHWSITVEVYGPDKTYLASGEAMVSHLRPGQSKVAEVILLDTNAESIQSYRVTLDGVVGKSGLRIDDQFELKVR